jgi:hypothetical protein
VIARFISCLIGLWLMAAPALLGYQGPAIVNDRICGPLIVSFAIIAMWEVTRSLRWINVVFGFWLMLAPLVLHYVTWRSAFNNLLCSLVLLVCALVPGRRTHRFAGGWTSLFD